ncbi:MAG: cytochrome c maturation protein CcmE [Spirochaetes bacterium]|nr:cytochrome c maturation protein CcmE [Spirochaetota bacterium]
MKKSKIIAISGIVISLVIISALGINNLRPYLSVSKVMEDPDKYDNIEIQVKGVVENYSNNSFYLSEDLDRIIVNLGNLDIPAEFENGIDVVITGNYRSDTNELDATQIITQCST